MGRNDWGEQEVVGRVNMGEGKGWGGLSVEDWVAEAGRGRQR